uniref:sensor histidine kinase n=1 Tax=Acetatifactor sp. TaxID=1872090 RepID=UPI0040561D8A
MTISLLFCLIVVAVLVGCIVLILIQYHRIGKQCAIMQDSLTNLEALNFELRAARHDYLNHLQVVYGLLELEEYQELKEYIKPVYNDMMKTSKALKTSKPALNALLKAKMDEAENQNIDVYVEVKSDLKHLKMEDWQLCKVLSNLIDNAITALQDVPDEKKIEIDINESKEKYWFMVSNNGPIIPEELLHSIFSTGFTTKKEEGHGMGLAIVTEILKDNNGDIDVKSDEKRTVFTVGIQKGED